MEVIIKNIEMPTKCDCCHFLHRIEQDDDHPAFYYCQLENIGEPITHIPMSSIDIDKRQDWCSLEPVVHGYWDDTITGVDGLYCCSACKNFETVDGGLNFCPNCGARMVDDDG